MKERRLFIRHILPIVCSAIIIIIAVVVTYTIFTKIDAINQRSDLNTLTTQTPTGKPRYTAQPSEIISKIVQLTLKLNFSGTLLS